MKTETFIRKINEGYGVFYSVCQRTGEEEIEICRMRDRNIVERIKNYISMTIPKHKGTAIQFFRNLTEEEIATLFSYARMKEMEEKCENAKERRRLKRKRKGSKAGLQEGMANQKPRQGEPVPEAMGGEEPGQGARVNSALLGEESPEESGGSVSNEESQPGQ